MSAILALHAPQDLEARDVAAFNQKADAFELCDKSFGARCAKFYICFGPKPSNFNYIFLSIGLNLYAGDEGATFQNRKDIIAILAPRSRNEDLYAIGKAKYFFRACAVAQGRIKGAENAQTV